MYVPKLRDTFEVARIDEDLFVIKNTSTIRYLECNRNEEYIFSQIDGEIDTEEISLRFYECFKYIGYNEIIEFFKELYRIELLVDEPPNFKRQRYRTKASLSPLKAQLFRSFSIQTLVRFIGISPLKYLFHRAIFFPLLTIAIIAALAFLFLIDTSQYHLFPFKWDLLKTIVLTLAIVYGLLFLSSTAKIAALSHFFRKINAFRLQIIGIVPWFSVDHNDILMEPVIKRLIVLSSGIYATGLVAALTTVHLLVAQWMPNILIAPFDRESFLSLSYRISFFSYLIIFFQLSPYYPSAGLSIFSEIFRFKTDRGKLLNYVTSLFRKSAAKSDKAEKSALRQEVGLSIGATWSIVYLFGFFQIVSFLLSSEVKQVFHSLLFSNEQTIRVVATMIIAMIVLPPILLLLYLIVSFERWLLELSMKIRPMLLLLIVQPLAIAVFLPIEWAFPVLAAIACLAFAGIVLSGRSLPYYPTIADRWLVLLFFFFMIAAATLFLIGIGQVEEMGTSVALLFILAVVGTSITLYYANKRRRGTLFSFSFFQSISMIVILPVYLIEMGELIALPVVSMILQLYAVGQLFSAIRTSDKFSPLIPEVKHLEPKFLGVLGSLSRHILGYFDTSIETSADAYRFFKDQLGEQLANFCFRSAGNILAIRDKFTLQNEVLTPGCIPVIISPFTSAESIEEMIRQIPLFAGAAPDETKMLLTYMKSRICQPGERIIEEGAEGDAFYAIKDGTFSVYKRDRYGYETKIGTLFQGDCFGEIALIEDVPRQAGVVADSLGVLFYLDRRPFTELIAKYPKMKERILTTIHRANLLRNVNIFHSLTSTQIFCMASRAIEKRVAEGGYIVKEGDEGLEFFIITKGKFDVFKGGTLLTTLGERNFFGEIALLKEVNRTASVIAKSDGELLIIPKSEFLTALASSGTLSSKFNEVSEGRSTWGYHA